MGKRITYAQRRDLPMSPLMCSFTARDRGAQVGDRARTGHHVFSHREVRKAQRKRVVCPECGRRLLGWVTVGYDDELRVTVPRHKRKGWWRKPRRGR